LSSWCFVFIEDNQLHTSLYTLMASLPRQRLT
jgi:hypothetical protein